MTCESNSTAKLSETVRYSPKHETSALLKFGRYFIIASVLFLLSNNTYPADKLSLDQLKQHAEQKFAGNVIYIEATSKADIFLIRMISADARVFLLHANASTQEVKLSKNTPNEKK
ncbi:MAG: hypothetical protein ACJAYG_001201 [Oceanicoccus sp.]|jgi:hypothetical protein